MNIFWKKRASFYASCLLPAAGGLLLFLFFFYLQTAFPLPVSGGLNPLREGKVLFSFQGRNTFLRLLSSSGRGERANPQNKRNRGNTSARLPEKELSFPSEEGKERKITYFSAAFIIISLYTDNPARAGPFPLFS